MDLAQRLANCDFLLGKLQQYYVANLKRAELAHVCNYLNGSWPCDLAKATTRLQLAIADAEHYISGFSKKELA